MQHTPLDEFRVRFMKVVGSVMTAVAVTITVALAVSGVPQNTFALVGVGSLVAAGALLLAGFGRGADSVHLVTFGVAALTTLFLSGQTDVRLVPVAVEVLFVLAVFSAFLVKPHINLMFGAFVVVMLFATTYLRSTRVPDPMVVSLGITDAVHFILLWAAATQVSRHLRSNQSALSDRLHEIDVVVERAKRIATGDLAGDVTRENEVSRVISDMLLGLRDIVSEVHDSVQVLASATTDIDSMATQQKRGAVHQSSAVTETRETIQSFAGSAREIAAAAEGVLRNAQSTQATNERANEQLNALARHTRRINELLEFVKGVASKSEILALNAALEGTRAGEAGRGFSLVAAQMQRLAESTANTIKDVKALTSDITKSTAATGISMEEAIKLARDTTVAARQISLITQQQSSGAEQVLEAMNDIATVTGEFAESTQDALAAISELKSLSDRLNRVAHRFVL
jgi:methyl-accepting chemotaxis protein